MTQVKSSPVSPISAPVGMLEHNGEWYYPLSEDGYNALVRAEGALNALSQLCWTENGGSSVTLENMGDLIAYPADALADVIKNVLNLPL